MKNKAHRDRKFLDWLREQDCAVTMTPSTDFAPNVPAHTFKSAGGGGMALKSGDRYSVPLTNAEHQKQSGMSEVKYWRDIINRDDALLKQMVQAWAEKNYFNRYEREIKL